MKCPTKRGRRFGERSEIGFFTRRLWHIIIPGGIFRILRPA